MHTNSVLPSLFMHAYSVLPYPYIHRENNKSASALPRLVIRSIYVVLSIDRVKYQQWSHLQLSLSFFCRRYLVLNCWRNATCYISRLRCRRPLRRSSLWTEVNSVYTGLCLKGQLPRLVVVSTKTVYYYYYLNRVGISCIIRKPRFEFSGLEKRYIL